MADMGIFDQSFKQCLVSQNLAGLSVYVNLSSRPIAPGWAAPGKQARATPAVR